MILELFSSIVVPVYSEWVHLDDLAHLDVAVCNTSLRERFRSQLQRCPVLLPKWFRMSDKWVKNISDWIYFRGIKLKGISISDFDGPVANKRTLSCLSDKLAWLRASNSIILEDVLDHCSIIMALHLDCIENESFIRLLPRLTNLQTLEVFDFSSHISRRCMDAIVEWCPHLRTFQVNVDASIVIRGCKELSEVRTILSSGAVLALIGAKNMTSVFVLPKYYDSDDSDADGDNNDSDNVGNAIKLIRKTSQLLSFSCDFSINDEVLIALSEHCPFLTCLHAAACTNDITDAGLRELAKCSDLSDLHISFDLVTDEGLTHLVKSCRNLTVLSTTDCHRLSDTAVLNALRYCEKLKELCLESNKCTDVGFMRAFSMRPSLEVLHGRLLTSKSVIGNVFDVEYLKVSYRRFELRKTVRSSQVCSFPFSMALEDSDWTAIIIQMPSLLKAHFHSFDITNKVVEALIMYCPRLTDVSVVFCPSVTANGIGMLIRSCRNLTKLTVRQDKMIAKPYDRGTNPSYASPLTHLVLQHCADSWVLDVVAAMCPLLRSFEVSSTIVGSDDICRLILCCPQLTHMNVSHCSLVDGSVLQAICECVAGGSRQWKSVNVEGCDGITKKDAAKYAPDFKEMGIEFII